MKTLIFSAHNQLLQSAAAIATATHAARRGERVLLASVGPDHILDAMIGQSLGPDALRLEENLAAIELDPLGEIGKRWEAIRATLRGGMVGRLRSITAEELPAFPGLDAVGALLLAERAAQSGRYDLIVADGPSPDALTGAMTLPDGARWVIRLIFGLDRGPGRSRSSLEQAIVPAAIIAPSAVAPLQDLRLELEETRARLDAATGSRVRLVVSPEELRLPALRRALQTLGLYGIASDELLVAGEPRGVEELRQEFYPAKPAPRPALRFAPLPTSPANRDEWALRGATVYRDGPVFDPDAPPIPAANPREARLAIPFLNPQTLDIAVINEEVVVQLGPLRRHLLLPGLSDGGNLRAKVEGETLRLWME
jgi:anion-transporting  ArsA/GET3 family ATPase